jgi:hypothetical protein
MRLLGFPWFGFLLAQSPQPGLLRSRELVPSLKWTTTAGYEPMPSNKTAGENVGPQKGKKNEEKENARQRRFARCWLPALVAIGKEVLLQTPLGSRTSCGAVGRACMSGVRFVRSDGWGWCPEWDWRPVRNDPPDRTFPRPRSTACPSTWISDTRLGVLKSQESGTFAGLRLEVPDPSQTVSLGPGIAITHNPFFFFFLGTHSTQVELLNIPWHTKHMLDVREM